MMPFLADLFYEWWPLIVGALLAAGLMVWSIRDSRRIAALDQPSGDRDGRGE